MKFKKNKKGFTMVEGIVIAVIVAILSAIAIPIYNGYIQDSQQDSVDNLAETAAAAANSWVRRKDENSMNIDLLDLKYDNTKYSISLDKGSDEITVSGHGKTKTVSYQ